MSKMDDTRKDIRFINSEYKTLFTIKDGERIKFTSGYDGQVSTRKCRWLDETHLTVNGETYHSCQLAEICERNGHTIEPAAAPEPKLDVLAAKYGDNMQAIEIPMTETAIGELVGGEYEISPLRYQSGKIAAALVRGADGIAVCGIGKYDTLTSLHPYTAQTYKRELSPAESSKIDAVCAANKNPKEREYGR
jgi:hypothetical protein